MVSRGNGRTTPLMLISELDGGEGLPLTLSASPPAKVLIDWVSEWAAEIFSMHRSTDKWLVSARSLSYPDSTF